MSIIDRIKRFEKMQRDRQRQEHDRVEDEARKKLQEKGKESLDDEFRRLEKTIDEFKKIK